MLLGDGLSAVGLIFILICVLRGGAQVWQICVGVTISSLFSALMDPGHKATVTDLLTPDAVYQNQRADRNRQLRQIPGITHPGRFPSHAVGYQSAPCY